MRRASHAYVRALPWAGVPAGARLPWGLSGLPIREKTGVETRVRVRPVRLTAAEDAVLHEIARAQSITVSDLLRRLIHAAVGQACVLPILLV
jgi:hypothetical protein